jgi:RND family efflux transporter MFP subunit
VILAGAGLAAKRMIDTRKKAPRRPAERRARVVDILRAELTREHVAIRAMGTVMPAQAVDIRPQVVGKLVNVDPELMPGGLFPAGAEIARIERRDYELAVTQREGEVASSRSAIAAAEGRLKTAQRDLKLEQGRQEVARVEYELLEEEITASDRELVLRVPQLASAEAAAAAAEAEVASARAALEAAQARLEDAQLDLARATITAPFNCIVQEKRADTGQVVGLTTSLAAVIGTDEYWIEAAVPVGDLTWLHIPRRRGERGSTVRIYNPAGWGPDVFREGEVKRLVADLDAEGRMARVLVSVPDPLALASDHADAPPLLIGSYVRVEIVGRALRDVVGVPRPLLREGRYVWVMNARDQLEIRPVEIAYRGRDTVFLKKGVVPDERLVITDLATPVEGMPLRIRELEAVAAGSTQEERS